MVVKEKLVQSIADNFQPNDGASYYNIGNALDELQEMFGGGCDRCYGKGYYSSLKHFEQGKVMPAIEYCECERGKILKVIVESRNECN